MAQALRSDDTEASPVLRPSSDATDVIAWGAERRAQRSELWPMVTMEIDPGMKDRVLNALLLIKGARLVAFEEPPR